MGVVVMVYIVLRGCFPRLLSSDDDNDERVHQWMDDACSQRRQRQQRYGNLDKCSSISDDSCNCGNCNPQLEDGISGPPGCVKWLVDLHDPSSK